MSKNKAITTAAIIFISREKQHQHSRHVFSLFAKTQFDFGVWLNL